MYDREKYRRQYNEIHKANNVVYFLQIHERPVFKIGKTNRLHYRLININQALYEESKLFGVISCCCSKQAHATEREIHALLSGSRLRGEWFSVVPETVSKLINQRSIINKCQLCQCTDGIASN